MTLPLVYLFGPTGRERSEELRYSLRSVEANLPHDGVWIFGYAPTWVDRDQVQVVAVPTVGRVGASAATTANLRAACAHPDMPDHFVLMNDDFFVTRPITGVPMLHRGPLADEIDRLGRRPDCLESAWYRLHCNTARLLAALGYDRPLSYELHVPMIVNRRVMAAALDAAAGHAVCKRTVYGNLADCGGVLAEDVKVRQPQEPIPDGPFVSTWEGSFDYGSHAGRELRALFPRPSVFERHADLRSGV
jgi:hypothetical protein